MIVGLDRVMDIDGQGFGGEGRAQGGETGAHGAGAVYPDRRAVTVGDGIERHVLKAESVLAVHAQLWTRRQQIFEFRLGAGGQHIGHYCGGG